MDIHHYYHHRHHHDHHQYHHHHRHHRFHYYYNPHQLILPPLLTPYRDNSNQQKYTLTTIICIAHLITSNPNSHYYFPLQVKIWFQNRRNKWKRQLAAEMEAANLSQRTSHRMVRVPVLYHENAYPPPPPHTRPDQIHAGPSPPLNPSLPSTLPSPLPSTLSSSLSSLCYPHPYPHLSTLRSLHGAV